MKDPTTRAEWLEAATMAYGYLLLESARQYGLIEGGPEIDMERCVAILVRAKTQGIVPDKNEAAAAVVALHAR